MNRTELANIITNDSLVDYTKEELREITDATNKIVRGTEQGKNAQWLVCDSLYRLQKVTKGKDFVKLAESLGYQKSTAYKYSKVGEYAIECGIGNEFTVSQVLELTSLHFDEVKKLLNLDYVNESMTCADIRETVKDWKTGIEQKETEETEEAEAFEAETEECEEAGEMEGTEDINVSLDDWLKECPVKLTKKQKDAIKSLLQ